MMFPTITVNTQASYPIYIDNHLLSDKKISEYCKALNKRMVIISDSHVSKLYANILKQQLEEMKVLCHLLTFPTGEASKTREIKQELEDQMSQLACGRDTVMIAIGGGVTTDLAGFIAATYCRGIPIIYIPTSLVAMVDASIGGKTGVNTPFGKNLIGTFTQPKAIFIDFNLLETLPKNEMKNGIVEMIKHTLLTNPELFKKLKTKNILKPENKKHLHEEIITSCKIKVDIIENDTEESSGLRESLNLGHTIGHALESASHYALSHGEAVAIGIITETYIAVQLGLLSQENLDQIIEIFQAYELPLRIPQNMSINDIMNHLKKDKKNRNTNICMTLLCDIGKLYMKEDCYSHAVKKEIIEKSLNWAISFQKKVASNF